MKTQYKIIFYGCMPAAGGNFWEIAIRNLIFALKINVFRYIPSLQIQNFPGLRPAKVMQRVPPLHVVRLMEMPPPLVLEPDHNKEGDIAPPRHHL